MPDPQRAALTETRLLLDALRADQAPEAWRVECEQAGVNWDALVVRAIVLGLATQLQQRLADWGLLTALPARAAAKLAVTWQAQEARSAAIFAQLAEALQACAAAGLKPIALKGMHLAALVYPRPALRPMNDIDLLFDGAELPRAEALLEGLGYGGRRKSAEVGPGVVKHTSTFRRAGPAGATPNPYLSADSERMIEPHTSLAESWFGLKVDVTPGVRERARAVTLAGQPGRVLADEDLLLHLCVHFCFHFIAGSPAMVQLLDLRAVTARAGLDWAEFVNRAGAQRAAPYAFAALDLARRLCGVAAPVLPELEAMTPAHIRRRVAQIGLEQLVERTQQRPLRTIRQRLWRGLSDRAEAARWAVDGRGRWQVWRTALDIGHTDTGQLIASAFVAKSRK